jgi:hypothetical protein
MAADAAASFVIATVPTTSCCCPARDSYGADYELLLPGARVHAAAGGDALSPGPPLASAHVASVLAVFTTELSPALIECIGLDAEVAATHTLAVAFPLLAGSLQVRTHVRAAARE